MFCKLQLLFFLSIAGCTSSIALPYRNQLHAPNYRRDHGEPGFALNPNPAATPSTNTIPSDTPTTSPPVVLTTTPPPPAPITTSSIISTSTTSTQPSSTITTTTIPSSSSAQISTSTSTTTSSFSISSASIISTTTTVTIPAAPLETAPPITDSSSPSSSRTWVIVAIFGLAFGLLGLVIFIITSTRRQARKKRAKSKKREVELVDVESGKSRKDEEMARVADVNGAVGCGEDAGVGRHPAEAESGGKWEEVVEAKRHGEQDDDWEQGLPAYCQ